TLEITESTLMCDPKATRSRLEALKVLGVRISIDDFGTGYSSLAYLRAFPADILKIDRSFVSDLGRSDEARALLRPMVQLSKALRIETIAEGIEDQTQLQLLKHEDCELGQGFLFSPPLNV